MKHQVQRLQQAYRELPWRKQARRVMWALAAMVAVAAVLALEVHFSAQALVLNYQLHERQQALLASQEQIVVLQTHLAQLMSVDHLLRAAEREGYRPVSVSQEHFVPVPPEALPSGVVAAPRARPLHPDQPSLPEAYTVSLVRWLEHYLLLEPMR